MVAYVDERVEEHFGVVGHDQHLSVLRTDEPLGNRVIEERGELVVEARDVEQTERLGVQPELRPCRHLDDLFDGPETAGQRDEPVAELLHHRFAVVHRRDDVELGQTVVADLRVRSTPRA